MLFITYILHVCCYPYSRVWYFFVFCAVPLLSLDRLCVHAIPIYRGYRLYDTVIYHCYVGQLSQ